MTARLVELRRQMTAKEATGLIGGVVPERPADLLDATVARDAETGEPILAYLPMGRDAVAELRRAVLGIRWHETYRAGTGSRNRSRVFGYRTRKPYLQTGEGCSRSKLEREHAETAGVLQSWAGHLGAALREALPDVVAADAATVAGVLPDWRVAETEPWTSGVINKTSALPWHRDGNNYPVWSAMPVVRRHVTGGHLTIPEYGVTAGCRDGWALFFPGYRLVHGVTPLRTIRPDGYRISVVYYALRGMKDCFTYAEETAYARRRRTVRERTIADRVADTRTAGPAGATS